MTNPQITIDLSEVLKEINQKLNKFEGRFDRIDDRLNKLEVGQARLEEKLSGQINTLDEKFTSLKDDVKDLKGTQKAQTWTLITTIITAIVGIFIALGKIIFFDGKI